MAKGKGVIKDTTYRCHHRTRNLTKEETASAESGLAVEHLLHKDCAKCEDRETCGAIQELKLRREKAISRDMRRPKGVYLCLIRVEMKDRTNYRCEKCALDHPKQFKTCSHKTLFHSQSTLDERKKEPEQLKFMED